MKKAIKGQYYMVKKHETSEFSPSICVDRGGSLLYFRFLNGSEMETTRVYYFEPLNHVRKC